MMLHSWAGAGEGGVLAAPHLPCSCNFNMLCCATDAVQSQAIGSTCSRMCCIDLCTRTT